MALHAGQGRPVDQAHRLRQLAGRHGPQGVPAQRRTHVIAVVSGKGGVGKTLLAANLSIALAARRQRVVLFDLDMGLANTDIVLGVDCRGTWADMLAGRRELERVIVQAPGGVSFVPGASGVARMANLSEFERHRLITAMRRIEDEHDVAVLDCGAGISQNVVSFAVLADTIVVVSTPEPTALTDAYAMIKAFVQQRGANRQSFGSIGVIVNFSESRQEGRETFERLADVAARFLHVPVSDFGYVLRDDHVPAAVRQRSPVVLRYPRCTASTCVLASAARLSQEFGQPAGDESWFYRVMNMFL